MRTCSPSSINIWIQMKSINYDICPVRRRAVKFLTVEPENLFKIPEKSILYFRFSYMLSGERAEPNEIRKLQRM